MVISTGLLTQLCVLDLNESSKLQTMMLLPPCFSVGIKCSFLNFFLNILFLNCDFLPKSVSFFRASPVGILSWSKLQWS